MVSALQVSSDLGVLEAKFLEKREMLAPLDTRNLAEMTLRNVNIPSKNAAQNLNLNNTQDTSIDMKPAGELEIVVADNLITAHIVSELIQIKNSVQYAINNIQGREADPELVARMNDAGITSDDGYIKVLSSMVATSMLMRAIGRYQTIDLIRAFTRDERLLVSQGQSTTVTAEDMGYIVSDSALAEGIDIIEFLNLTSKFKQRMSTPITATVKSIYTEKIMTMQFGAVVLMTHMEVNDLLTNSITSNASGTAVGNIDYVVFRGFDHVVTDGNWEKSGTPMVGYVIAGCLCLIMSDLYTNPEITALDVDTDYTTIPGDDTQVEIDRKIIVFHPSALTLWTNYETARIVPSPDDTVIFKAMNSVRTTISKSLQNGALIHRIKRKIPAPKTVTALNKLINSSSARRKIGSYVGSGPDFSKGNDYNKNMQTDTITFTDKETGKQIKQISKAQLQDSQDNKSGRVIRKAENTFSRTGTDIRIGS